MAIPFAIAIASSVALWGCRRYESAILCPTRSRSTESMKESKALRITSERQLAVPSATSLSRDCICSSVNRVGTIVVIQSAYAVYRASVLEVTAYQSVLSQGASRLVTEAGIGSGCLGWCALGLGCLGCYLRGSSGCGLRIQRSFQRCLGFNRAHV